LLTRNGHDWADRYPLIAEAAGALGVRSCLIDGEAVACDDDGMPSFDRLRYRRADGAVFLSNIGIGHGAIDAGVGYTYLNPQTGHEFSGVLGFTYNFTNQSTQYQNGVDMHFDWGASQFLTKQFLSVLYNNQMLRAFASLRSESRSLNVPPRHASTISTLCTSI